MTDRIKVLEVADASRNIVFKDISLDLAQEDRRLIDHFSLTLSPGDKFILTGESGSGKSSLVRAFRGLWHAGQGDIVIPAGMRTLCVSQRVHLPRTNLRGVLSSPAPEGTFSDADIDCVLQKVGHDRLRSSLPENQAKPDVLFGIARPHIEMALKIWDRQIQRLSDPQREEFRSHVRTFIMEHGEQFFDRLLKPYIDEQLKQTLAGSIDTALDGVFLFTKGMGQGMFLPFEYRIRNLARNFSKFVLQGTGNMARDMRLDGVKISRSFSGGEQQRIPFAQILLHKPDIVIIDEGTSALDKDSGLKLYNMVFEALPNTIFISVAHNTHLIPIHSRHGHLESQEIKVQAVTPPSP